MIKRGDIFYARLDKGVGSEQNGSRPVIIVQNNIGNLYSNTVIVVPVTSAGKKPIQTHVSLGRNYGLYWENSALAEQIMTFDKHRLGEYIGTVDDMKMAEIDEALKASLEIDY
ncbi:MAG: type II toxin-antitoxin system PemK/MazF family toxin [Ruminococcus sp.]|nr:type II toxin-antitoxin system PemK/MazF family toxin [Ruminococcus sp.]